MSDAAFWSLKPLKQLVLAAAWLALAALPCHAAGPSSWKSEVIADDLAYPWAINHSGPAIVITEAAGTIAIVENGKLRRSQLQTSSPVAREGGSGLLGMALAPDFAASGRAYAYYTYRSANAALANKVVQVRYDGRSWRETRVLLHGIPGHQLYNGGRMAIGPDGHLYVTTGWAHDDSFAQDLKSLGGKILRMTLDGGIPPGNPFGNSYVWSYGHRNPQGLAWSADGRLFVAEHGSTGHDELNVVVAGGNYGWPLATGEQQLQGMTKPLIQSGSDTWAPSGIGFSNGRLLVAALGARGLLAYDEGRGSMATVFASGDRLRDVVAVGDTVYVITTNTSPRASRSAGADRLMKLSPR